MSKEENNKRLTVNISGYEGPLDLLIDLSKKQRVDITKVSILELAEQYLNFINNNIDDIKLSADYLVMASFLAYLKSKMLLPKDNDELSNDIGEEFTNRLIHYNAIKIACKRLDELPQEGRDFFVNKTKSEFFISHKVVLNASLNDLINYYALLSQKHKKLNLQLQKTNYFSVEDGIKWLDSLMKGKIAEWTDIFNFFPSHLSNNILKKSATVSLLMASLTLARDGVLEINQESLYKNIYVKVKEKYE